MYPYLEIFWTKLYMTGIWIVVSCFVFLITVYVLSKKYHQEFIKFFNWLPRLLICIYLSGLYFTFFFDGGIIPTSFGIFSPYWYNFSLVGILLAASECVSKFVHFQSKWLLLIMSAAISIIPAIVSVAVVARKLKKPLGQKDLLPPKPVIPKLLLFLI